MKGNFIVFSIATPWLLLLIPLPWILHWIRPKNSVKDHPALRVPFFEKIKIIAESKSHVTIKTMLPLIVGLLIWSLFVFAASGPQWLGKPIVLPQRGRNIMLAVDLSGSMRIPDMALNHNYLTRLAVVKEAATNFITSRKGDRLGLILFGTRAYLQTPLTFDRQTVLQMLDDATIGLAGTQTAIGDAIGLAIKQLKKAPGKDKVLILLTDGGNNAGIVSPLDAAGVAAKLGIKIYTIGIGASRLVVPGTFGPLVVHPTSELDEKTLKQIAQITDGLFFRAQNDLDLQHVYQSLNKIVPIVAAKNIFRPIKPLYPWPLGLALLLSVFVSMKKREIR